MASRAESNRNNVRAGVFVTGTLLLAGIVVILLTGVTDRLLRSTHSYTVRFGIGQGVDNLKPGAEVRVGGYVLGSVDAIEPEFDEPFEAINVRFSIDSQVTLFDDANILVDGALIGADAWLAVTRVGTAGELHKLGDNDVIDGSGAPGMLDALLGPDGAQRTAGMIASLPDDYAEYVVPILKNVRTTSADMRWVAGDLREAQWRQWTDQLNHALAWANAATDRFDSIIGSGQAILDESQVVLQENRPDIRATVSNARTISDESKALVRRLSTETIEQANALLDSGRTAIDEALAVVARIRQDYEGWNVSIDETLANGRLASQQIKLAGTEISRNPWKVLYRPTADELEHELLYEAARHFAMAAADLKASSESVNRILENHGDRLAADPTAVQKLHEKLAASFGKYEMAQQELLDVLVDAQGQ